MNLFSPITLLIKRILFSIVYFYLYSFNKTLYLINRNKHIVNRAKNTDELISLSYIYHIIIYILDIKNKGAEKKIWFKFNFRNTFFKSYINLYERFFLTSLSKLTTTIHHCDCKNETLGNNTGLFYFSFHFIGRFDAMIHYLATHHEEIYLVIQKSFFEKGGIGSALGISSEEELNNKYLQKITKKSKIICVYTDTGVALLRIKRLLEEKKVLFVNFDFFNISKKDFYNNPKQYVEFKQNGKRILFVPNALLKIIKASNTLIKPIVFYRKDITLNLIHIFPSIRIEDDDANYEKCVNMVFNNLMQLMKLSPENIDPVLWGQFKNCDFNYSIKAKDDENTTNDLKKMKINQHEYFIDSSTKAINIAILQSMKIVKMDRFFWNEIRTLIKKDNLFNLKKEDLSFRARINTLISLGLFVNDQR